MTKWQLIAALLAKGQSSKITMQGFTGYLVSVQREDGSGSSFNVMLLTAKGYKTLYVRTED